MGKSVMSAPLMQDCEDAVQPRHVTLQGSSWPAKMLGILTIALVALCLIFDARQEMRLATMTGWQADLEQLRAEHDLIRQELGRFVEEVRRLRDDARARAEEDSHRNATARYPNPGTSSRHRTSHPAIADSARLTPNHDVVEIHLQPALERARRNIAKRSVDGGAAEETARKGDGHGIQADQDSEDSERRSDPEMTTNINADTEAEPSQQRKKSGERDSNFEIDAVHMYPKIYNKSADQEHIVDCGRLHNHRLTITCEIMVFWELDHQSQERGWMQLANGVVLIQKTGTYFVYAQVSHHDKMGAWSFGIFYRKKNDHHTDHAISQCPGVEPHIVEGEGEIYPILFQCSTSRIVHLRKGDQIFIKNEYFEHGNRIVRLDRHLTFWGLVKLNERR